MKHTLDLCWPAASSTGCDSQVIYVQLQSALTVHTAGALSVREPPQAAYACVRSRAQKHTGPLSRSQTRESWTLDQLKWKQILRCNIDFVHPLWLLRCSPSASLDSLWNYPLFHWSCTGALNKQIIFVTIWNVFGTKPTAKCDHQRCITNNFSAALNGLFCSNIKHSNHLRTEVYLCGALKQNASFWNQLINNK